MRVKKYISGNSKTENTRNFFLAYLSTKMLFTFVHSVIFVVFKHA